MVLSRGEHGQSTQDRQWHLQNRDNSPSPLRFSKRPPDQTGAMDTVKSLLAAEHWQQTDPSSRVVEAADWPQLSGG